MPSGTWLNQVKTGSGRSTDRATLSFLARVLCSIPLLLSGDSPPPRRVPAVAGHLPCRCSPVLPRFLSPAPNSSRVRHVWPQSVAFANPNPSCGFGSAVGAILRRHAPAASPHHPPPPPWAPGRARAPGPPRLCVAYLNLDAGGMALRWMQPRRRRSGGGVVLVRLWWCCCDDGGVVLWCSLLLWPSSTDHTGTAPSSLELRPWASGDSSSSSFLLSTLS